MIKKDEIDNYFNTENILLALFIRDKIKMNYGFEVEAIETIENSEMCAVSIEVNEEDLELADEHFLKPYPQGAVKIESNTEEDNFNILITFSLFKDSYANSDYYGGCGDKNMDGEKILSYLYEDYIQWLDVQSKERTIIMGALSNNCSCNEEFDDGTQTELDIYEE